MLTGLSLAAIAVLLGISLNLGIPGQELLGTLRFHIGVAVLALPLLLLLSGAWLRAVVMLGLVGLSLGQGAAIVIKQHQERTLLENATPAASLRVLSFNVLAGNVRAADAVRYIIESGADIVLVMETSGIRNHLDAISSTYPYRVGCEDRNCDLAVLSRTPFLTENLQTFSPFPRQRLIQVGVQVAGYGPVNIVATHLTKPYFDDLALFELDQVRALVSEIEGPLVLAGDFNAAAWSNAVSRFTDQLDLIPPPYHPATWPVGLGPLGVPIDNMFSRGAAVITAIAPTPEAFGSNHLGLMATVSLY